MKCFVLITAFISTIFSQIWGQSTAFVFYGGPTIGLQKWDNSFNREPLFQWHGALAIESVDNEEDRSALFMQLGYHVKGSATRFRFFFQGGGISQFEEQFRFNNLSLVVGAKQKFPLGDRGRYYYFGGLRGDYTLSTNLGDLRDNNQFAALYYPQEGFVNKYMFGASVGGGIEWMLADVVGVQANLSVNPDFTLQYNQPPIPNVIDPLNPSQNTTIPERRIRNTTIELSIGLRLLRKVVYVD